MKPTIYALLVAIDNYPIPEHRLSGCVNDRNAFHEYLMLQKTESKNFNMRIKLLTDEEATRKGIIQNFRSHYKKASEGDIVLLYFSGHGSQIVAPAELLDETPNGMLQTMVTHDSRLKGGMDIVDKELRFLIHEATEKGARFISVVDSCHSGSMMRSTDVKSRMADPGEGERTLESLLGFKEGFYNIHEEEGVKKAKIQYRGSTLALSASQDDQTAKELKINGQSRGIFTYSLLETLNETGGQISNLDLIQLVTSKINGKVRDQNPQIDATHEEDKKRLFLDGTLPPLKGFQTIIKDPKKGWIMKMGSLHGLPANPRTPISLAVYTVHSSESNLYDNDKALANCQVKEVFSTYSTVSGLGIEKQDKILIGRILNDYKSNLNLYLAISDDAKAEIKLMKLLKDFTSFHLVEEKNDADYWIRIQEGAFRLTKPNDDRPVFKRIKGSSDADALEFLKKIASVASWEHYRQIFSSGKQIGDDDLEIELHRALEYDVDSFSNFKTEKVDWRDNPCFPYEYDENQPEGYNWVQPAMKVKVTNKSKNTLWVSGLYFSTDFAIINDYLVGEQLQAGGSVWMKFIHKDGGQVTEYEAIPLVVDDAIYSYGVTEVENRIKIIASTENFQSGNFNQEPLEMDFNGRSAKFSRPKVKVADWKTYDIDFSIERPMEAVKVTPSSPGKLKGLSIKGPKGFSGNARLTSVQNAARGIGQEGVFLKPGAFFGEGFESHGFTRGIHNAPALDVLEISDFKQKSKVKPEAPLELSLDDPLAENESLIPLGYDPETGTYYPLGFMETDEEGNSTIFIEELPPNSPGTQRSLGGSIKIFFQKVFLSKIGFSYEYPILACATVKDENEEYKVDYEKDLAKIKTAVGNSKRIILFIHGIIGDTKDMTKAVMRGKIEEGEETKTILDNYDLVLTFDYENLNTPIEENGALLKKKLLEVGLTKEHTLHIVAHSMGGLVSRWMIEKEGGNEYVNHLIQLGTPNGGSHWTRVQDMANWGLNLLVGKLTFAQPYLAALAFATKTINKAQYCLAQMNPNSDFYKQLSAAADPQIPYSIVMGNTSLIKTIHEDVDGKYKRLANFLKQRGAYVALQGALFQAANDVAVSTESIGSVPSERVYPPQKTEIDCDHMSYFSHPGSLKLLTEIVYSLKN